MKDLSAAILLIGALLVLPLGLAGQQSANIDAMSTLESASDRDAMSDRDAIGDAGAQPDFLFSPPGFTLTLRGGMFLNRGESELHRDVIDRLTLERSDFNSGLGGVEIGVRAGEHLEIVVGGDWGQTTVSSASRHFREEADGSLIVQNTRLRNGPSVMAGVKAYALPRGESISRFAWTPRRLNAFVGAGLGATGYQLEQWGDFVDETTLLIFTEDLRSSGAAFSAYAGGGIDISVSNRVSLVGEGRYVWSRTELGMDYGFRELDLSGLRLTAGLGFRL